MRQISTLITVFFFAAFLLAIGSCSKTGTAGATGPKGDTGTANVIYSAWTTLTFKVDTVHSGSVIDSVGSEYTWSAPKITADIVNKGELKVYVNFGTTTAPDIAPIPYFDGSVYLNDQFSVGEIYMYSNAIVAGIPFRYILIPGGTGARSAVDWKNYASVKKYLHLPD